MKRILKDKKAITLIALVITIVVLVILAVVTISLTIGSDGLIARAIKAAKGYNDAQEKNKQSINDLYGQLSVATDGTVTIDATQLNTMIQQEVAKQLAANKINTTYSANGETIIGTWTDGKPIYQRVVEVTSDFTTNTLIDCHPDKLVNLDGVIARYDDSRDKIFYVKEFYNRDDDRCCLYGGVNS